jgi:hypothetical protein
MATDRFICGTGRLSEALSYVTYMGPPTAYLGSPDLLCKIQPYTNPGRRSTARVELHDNKMSEVRSHARPIAGKPQQSRQCANSGLLNTAIGVRSLPRARGYTIRDPALLST